MCDPTPPRNISFDVVGANYIMLSWGEPLNMSGVVKSYDITYWNSSSAINWTQTRSTPNVTLQNLTSGTNYSVSVVTNGVRHYPSVTVLRWVYTKPFPIKDLKILVTSGTGYLHWTKPDEYKSSYSYRVRSNLTSSSLSNTTVRMELLMLTGLSNGDTYTFLVYTIAGNTESDPVSLTTCIAPGQAVNVTVNSNRLVNSLVVKWMAPAGKWSYYTVTITGDVNKTWQNTSTQVTFTGLSPGREYNITVQTISGSCASENTTVTEATFPSQPGNITFNSVGTNSITLSWGNPVNMTGVPISYEVTYWKSSPLVNWTMRSSSPSVMLPSLTSGTNYTISVVTVGVRQHSSVPVTKSVYTRPMSVKNLQTRNVTSSTVVLAWTRPDGYIGFNSYRVQTMVTLQYTITGNITVNSETATIGGLTPGETYTFLIYTRAADNVTESDPVPLTTCTVPGQVSRLAINFKSNSSLGVTWVAPAGKTNYYNVDLTGVINRKIQTSLTQVTFLGLLPNREYTITVQAVSGSCNQISPPVTEATYPNPPAYLTVKKIGTNSLTLSWGEPENMIDMTKIYNISWNASWTATSNTTVTLQNLTPRTNYTIQVVTVGVRGSQSEVVSRSVYTSPLEQPGTMEVVRSSSGEAMDITFQGFDTSNGPIVAYALIMTTDLYANKPLEGVLAKTYNDFKAGKTKTYVSSLIENIKAAARSNVISAHVGDGTLSHGYVNGPLDPKLQYRVSIAGFTNINYDPATNTVNEDQSTVTITSYSGSPLTTTTASSSVTSTNNYTSNVSVTRSSDIDIHQAGYMLSRGILVTALLCVCHTLIGH